MRFDLLYSLSTVESDFFFRWPCERVDSSFKNIAVFFDAATINTGAK